MRPRKSWAQLAANTKAFGGAYHAFAAFMALDHPTPTTGQRFLSWVKSIRWRVWTTQESEP